MKTYYKDEDFLDELFCKLKNCESDPTGCTGCNAQERWVDENYSKFMLDETNYDEFISKDELFEWIDKELKYEKKQLNEFNKGYFHALKKLKSKVIIPSLNNTFNKIIG